MNNNKTFKSRGGNNYAPIDMNYMLRTTKKGGVFNNNDNNNDNKKFRKGGNGVPPTQPQAQPPAQSPAQSPPQPPTQPQIKQSTPTQPQVSSQVSTQAPKISTETLGLNSGFLNALQNVMKGGCPSSNNKNCKKGGTAIIELAPFISSLVLLGLRVGSDKDMSETIKKQLTSFMSSDEKKSIKKSSSKKMPSKKSSTKK